MADNRISETRHPSDTDHDIDDPLAELARIVGFEDEEADAAADEAAEPGFDLEAELMRELQIDVGDKRQRAVAEPVLAEKRAAGGPVVEPSEADVSNEPDTLADGAMTEDFGTDGMWPHAVQDSTDQMNSLEAELQAAFSALEGKRPEPKPVAEAPVQAEQVPEQAVEDEPFAEAAAEMQMQVTQEPALAELAEPAAVRTAAAPREKLAESDELKQAYDRLQRDIEAAKPQETDFEDSEDQLTEMLLAEMADVESEAADNRPASEEIPFDAGDIEESDSLPENVAELDVPEYQTEPVVPLYPQESAFGLPLEDELDVLTAPEPFEQPAAVAQPAQAYGQPGMYKAGQAAAVGAAHVAYGATAPAAMQDQYDDEPGMEGYSDEFDDDVFTGDDDFSPDDLVSPNYGSLDGVDRGSGRKGLFAAILVLGIAVAGGGGYYLWNGGLGSGGAGTGPMVIAANNEPVKVRPEDPGGKTVPNEDLAVYGNLEGNETNDSDDQQLVTTTEEPVDIVQRTLDPDTLPLEGRTTVDLEQPKAEDRLGATSTLDPDPSATSQTTGIAPRRVRTLVVKPDGTIVARDDSVASETDSADAGSALTGAEDVSNGDITTGTTALSGATDTVRQVQPSSSESIELANASGTLPVVQVAPQTGNGADSDTLPPIDENLRNSGALPLPQEKPVRVASAETIAQSATDATTSGTESAALQTTTNAPVPTTRPSEQPVNIVEAVTERGNLAGTTQAANPGGYMMQISSQPSEEAARASYESLSQRYASIIGGRGYNIQRADIENRGVFYRVRIPAGTKEAANALCAEYKSAGGSCFVAR